MIQVGNKAYGGRADIPERVPVFPLSGALLLPGSQLPLNIFEPRYLAMIDDSLSQNRVIGIIQPALEASAQDPDHTSPVPDLCAIGCLGRIAGFAETGDGRYVVTLGGICRFRLTGEDIGHEHPYRICGIEPDDADLAGYDTGETVDREGLLESLRSYLAANNLQADWSSIEQASTASLVNSLSIMSPYGPPEKQALLEAHDIKTRADTLIAITEMALARDGADTEWQLQ